MEELQYVDAHRKILFIIWILYRSYPIRYVMAMVIAVENKGITKGFARKIMHKNISQWRRVKIKLHALCRCCWK